MDWKKSYCKDKAEEETIKKRFAYSVHTMFLEEWKKLKYCILALTL